MPSNTLKRDGSWVVELLTPLKSSKGDVNDIAIQPPSLDHTDRWTHGVIASTMALLSELSGQPENLLRTMTYPDVDRVMLAFTALMPPVIVRDFSEGKRPLFTPVEELAVNQDEASPVDPIDPRFPLVDGPVRRFPNPPGGIAMTPSPDVAKKATA